jgi:hypothetical protein
MRFQRTAKLCFVSIFETRKEYAMGRKLIGARPTPTTLRVRRHRREKRAPDPSQAPAHEAVAASKSKQENAELA